MIRYTLFSRPLFKFIFIIGLLTSFSLSVTAPSLNLITGDTIEVVLLDWQQDSEEKDKKLESPSGFSKKLWGYPTAEITPKIINFYSYSFKEIYSPPPEM
jgi:hypothetical protein